MMGATSLDAPGVVLRVKQRLDNLREQVRVRRTVVDQDGAVVDESERMIEHGRSGPAVTINGTDIETGWEPES